MEPINKFNPDAQGIWIWIEKIFNCQKQNSYWIYDIDYRQSIFRKKSINKPNPNRFSLLEIWIEKTYNYKSIQYFPFIEGKW